MRNVIQGLFLRSGTTLPFLPYSKLPVNMLWNLWSLSQDPEKVRATLPPFSAGGENIAMRGVFGAPYSGRAFTLPGAAGGTVSAVVADASGDAADWLLSASMAFTT